MSLKKALEDARKALADAKSKKLASAAGAGNKAKGLQSKAGMSDTARKTLQKFGVKSFDELTKVNTSDRKFAYLGKEEIAQVKKLKESVDIAVLSSMIFKKPVKNLSFFHDELEHQLKAFGINGGETGSQWIPTMVSDSYIDEFNLDRKVAGLFTEVRMPSNPYKWPVLSNGAIARRVGQLQALAQKQQFKSDTITFDAVKMTSQYELPEELVEDSAVDVIRIIRQELMEGQEKAMEIGILEGDADGVHMHNFSQLPDVVAGTLTASVPDSPEFFFDGIRKRLIAAGLAVCGVDGGGNSLSEAELSQARTRMGKFGVDPSALAIIAGVKVYNQMLQLDDVRTLEQYGAQATVLSGELAKYEGIPVVVSEYLREDLGAAGVNTSTVANNNKGSLIFVNRKRWFTATRRPIQIRVENYRTAVDGTDLVSFSRKAFQAVLKADGSNYAQESSASMVYNIGL